MGDTIEKNEEEEIYFNINDFDSQYPLGCELPFRLGLTCRHWMYLTFVKKSAIPCSLIHPRWFFDGPDYLEQPSTTNYSHNQEFTYTFLPNATTNSSDTSKVDTFQEIIS